MKRISLIAYKLDLPLKMRCHPVFHVSLLESYFENKFNDRKSKGRKKNIWLSTNSIKYKIPERINDMKAINEKKKVFLYVIEGLRYWE